MSQRTATEAALLLADLVSDREAFPAEAVEDLRRMLERKLTMLPAGSLRFDRLQLLLELMLEDGTVPPMDLYERERAARNSPAPAASTLIGAYGTWLAATRAAARFLDRGGRAHVAHTHRHVDTRQRVYHPREIIAGITFFHERFGTWPTISEYIEWSRIQRVLARNHGAPDPRLASHGVIDKHFGTFSRAVQAARTATEGRGAQ